MMDSLIDIYFAYIVSVFLVLDEQPRCLLFFSDIELIYGKVPFVSLPLEVARPI